MSERLENQMRRLAWEYLARAQRSQDLSERRYLVEQAVSWHALAAASAQTEEASPTAPDRNSSSSPSSETMSPVVPRRIATCRKEREARERG